MTVLATFVGGWGHAEPLLPLARRAEERGHRVAFAGQAAVVPRLAALGFDTFVVGPDTLATSPRPLVAQDWAVERAQVRDHFVAEFGAQRLAALTALVEREAPSLVVCDEMDVGAVLAAERCGLPCVTVGVLAAGRLLTPALVGEAWRALRAGHGLPDDPSCDRLAGDLHVVPVPRSFRDPDQWVPPALQPVRPAIVDQARPAPPSLVYATLGTVFPLESGDLFTRLATALARTPTEAVLTVGWDVDAAGLRAVAANVRVERFVPQSEVLGRASAVVCHGGSGTLVAALSLGVPVVVLPLGADQRDNADRCVELGVGVVLDPMTADAATIADAIEVVTADGRYRSAAAELAREAAGQPPLDELAALTDLL